MGIRDSIYGGDVELRRWFGRRAVEKPFSGHHVGLYGQIVTYAFELDVYKRQPLP